MFISQRYKFFVQRAQSRYFSNTPRIRKGVECDRLNFEPSLT